MRLIVFSLVFLVLTAAASLAEGLEITRIDARVEYSDAYVYRLEQIEQMSRANYASVPLANNSKIKVDLFPGANLTFSIVVGNTFRSSSDPNIRNIFVNVKIKGTKKDISDLEERSADFELEPGQDNRADVLFNIPYDAQSGLHNVEIEVNGISQNGSNKTAYKTELKLKLDVRKHSHDIAITSASLSPSAVECKRKVKIEAEAMNLGASTEDKVALEFKSTSIGVNSADRDVYLSSSDDENEGEKMHAKTLNIEVPSFFQPGTYPITVNLYWKSHVLFDTKTLNLVVKDCSRFAQQNESTQDKGNATDGTIIPGKEETGNNGQEAIIQKASLASSPMLLAMFSGAFIALIMAAVVIFGYLAKSRAH